MISQVLAAVNVVMTNQRRPTDKNDRVIEKNLASAPFRNGTLVAGG